MPYAKANTATAIFARSGELTLRCEHHMKIASINRIRGMESRMKRIDGDFSGWTFQDKLCIEIDIVATRRPLNSAMKAAQVAAIVKALSALSKSKVGIASVHLRRIPFSLGNISEIVTRGLRSLNTIINPMQVPQEATKHTIPDIRTDYLVPFTVDEFQDFGLQVGHALVRLRGSQHLRSDRFATSSAGCSFSMCDLPRLMLFISQHFIKLEAISLPTLNLNPIPKPFAELDIDLYLGAKKHSLKCLTLDACDYHNDFTGDLYGVLSLSRSIVFACDLFRNLDLRFSGGIGFYAGYPLDWSKKVIDFFRG